MSTKNIAIVGLIVIAAVFGLIAAFSKTTNSTTTGPGSTTTGGVGNTILTGLCAALGIKC